MLSIKWLVPGVVRHQHSTSVRPSVRPSVSWFICWKVCVNIASGSVTATVDFSPFRYLYLQ